MGGVWSGREGVGEWGVWCVKWVRGSERVGWVVCEVGEREWESGGIVGWVVWC